MEILEDQRAELPEAFLLSFTGSASDGKIVLTDSVEASIQDDDTLSTNPRLLSFTQGSYFIFEGEKQAQLGIVVSDGAGYFSVRAASLDFTATEGSDYRPIDHHLGYEFAIDQLPLTVQLIDDADPEDDEALLISLSAPTDGYDLGIPSEAILTILDDDSPCPSHPIAFPLDLGSKWTYQVFGEGWWTDPPGPNPVCISVIREDTMDEGVALGTTSYSRLTGTSPCILPELFLRQEGPILFCFTAADTLEEDPPSGGHGRDFPWQLADLSAGELVPDTLILQGDLADPYGHTLCVVRQLERTSVAVPAGVFRDVVHVQYLFEEPFSRSVLHLYIADGVGIVKEVGYGSTETDVPGASNSNWTARLVHFNQR